MLAVVIMNYIDTHETLNGTAAEMKNLIGSTAKNYSTQSFVNELIKLEPSLAQAGYVVSKGPRRSCGQTYDLWKASWARNVSSGPTATACVARSASVCVLLNRAAEDRSDPRRENDRHTYRQRYRAVDRRASR